MESEIAEVAIRIDRGEWIAILSTDRLIIPANPLQDPLIPKAQRPILTGPNLPNLSSLFNMSLSDHHDESMGSSDESTESFASQHPHQSQLILSYSL